MLGHRECRSAATGDRAREYIIQQQRPDGALLLVPDTGSTAIRRRHDLTPATLAEFEEEYGPIRPPDGEG